MSIMVNHHKKKKTTKTTARKKTGGTKVATKRRKHTKKASPPYTTRKKSVNSIMHKRTASTRTKSKRTKKVLRDTYIEYFMDNYYLEPEPKKHALNTALKRADTPLSIMDVVQVEDTSPYEHMKKLIEKDTNVQIMIQHILEISPHKTIFDHSSPHIKKWNDLCKLMLLVCRKGSTPEKKVANMENAFYVRSMTNLCEVWENPGEIKETFNRLTVVFEELCREYSAKHSGVYNPFDKNGVQNRDVSTHSLLDPYSMSSIEEAKTMVSQTRSMSASSTSSYFTDHSPDAIWTVLPPTLNFIPWEKSDEFDKEGKMILFYILSTLWEAIAFCFVSKENQYKTMRNEVVYKAITDPIDFQSMLEEKKEELLFTYVESLGKLRYNDILGSEHKQTTGESMKKLYDFFVHNNVPNLSYLELLIKQLLN